MKSINRPPIVVFAYNRPAHLSRLFDSLVKCSGFEETQVTVFVDGPRGPSDLHAVEETRAVVVNLRLPNVIMVAREFNLGLRRSIHSGVSEMCSAHGRVIVLEDDFELSPITLDWFREALDKYAEVDRVWSVCAFMHRVPALRNYPSSLVLPWASPWGWATWERAWSKFELDRPVSELMLKSRYFRLVFDLGGMRDFTEMLKLQKDGYINSWFIQWYRLIVECGGVSIFPPQSLVRNAGFGASGTHASRLNPYGLLSIKDTLADLGSQHPDELIIDWWAVDVISSSLDARLQKWIGRLGAVKRRLRRLIRVS